MMCGTLCMLMLLHHRHLLGAADFHVSSSTPAFFFFRPTPRINAGQQRSNISDQKENPRERSRSTTSYNEQLHYSENKISYFRAPGNDEIVVMMYCRISAINNSISTTKLFPAPTSRRVLSRSSIS